ncbi:endoplasmic reticulum aminopeptidase 1-like isoform X2 [Physella acuta]|uniref:endoplasmic reticulum aminopeptidase 1-like isoform X2 n=1 Tax=Physella acuta TaxID=109671 RepID=UPI0027DD9136|nr:endoplasmic reticulum aminopeptidase 1-like isoform X2 [Physella acuta]
MDLLEEKCFIDEGEAILNKKAVYEPTKGQRFRQVVCSKGWAICILMSMGTAMIAIAVIAAFARPGSTLPQEPCSNQQAPESSGHSAADLHPGYDKPQTYIATNGEPFPWKDLRLPGTVVPESYSIFLHANISQSYFKGRVEMVLEVVSDTNFIVFHTQDLNISDLSLYEVLDHRLEFSKTRLQVRQELEYPRNDQYYVRLDSTIRAKTRLELHVNFRGSLESVSKMKGFYKSEYTVKGETRYMASTQFEATSARNAFPCFDEPQLKAKFKMSIVRNKEHITLFNTPLKGSTPYGEGLVQDEYEESVKMSTYLVAFVICDFKNMSKTTEDGVEVRLFAPEDKIYMGEFALNASVTVLNYYNSFFGIPYPLPKQDLIAIPNFAAGAMENWGLITYRDTSILYDPAISTEGTKKWVTIVVAHELAHQWFGNLVTMKWWNDLWLNEGFASYVERIGADQVDKEFHMIDSFMEPFSGSMYLDSLATSHPIEVEVLDPSEVDAAFDKISYDKGGSLIRMLQSVIGEADFKNGLTSYLRKHEYGNAETKDLWDAFEEASNLDAGLKVSVVMDTWTKQMGYPVVTVVREKGKLLLTQERFLIMNVSHNHSVSSYKSPYNYKWYIPFTYSTSANPSRQSLVWMMKDSASVDLPNDSVAWIKGNVGSYGYYRVNYDKEGWQAIIKQLRTDHTVFAVTDRVGLISDAFSLARAGLIDYTVPLEMTKYLINETDYFVWEEALSHIYFLESQLKLQEEFDLLKSFLLGLAKPLIDKLGWENSGTHLTKKLRASMITLAIAVEYQPAVDIGISKFKQWIQNQSTLMNDDLRGIIYGTGLKYGKKADWDIVFQRYLTSNVPSEKITLLSSLADTTDARVLQIFLEYSLDDTKVKSQNSGDVIEYVAANNNGFLLSWRFFRLHWDELYERYGDSAFILSSVLKSVTVPFSTQFDYDEIVNFFKNKELGTAKMALDQALEVVQSHIDWARRNMDTVKLWLKTNVSPK